ncbi:MAG TPA: AzlC family ABC transporter permease [Euzebyales bacterium]
MAVALDDCTTVAGGRVARRRPRSPTPVRAGARAGLRTMAPVAAAVIPFAVVLGVAIDASVVPAALAVVMAPALYAGSAHLAAVSVLDAGGTALVATSVAMVINARYAVYGAALAHRFRDQPTWFRWLGPWMIVDETFTLAAARNERDPAWFRAFWLAQGTLIGAVYTAMVLVGALLGSIVPSDTDLSFAVPAALVALLVGQLRDRSTVVAAAVGATVAAVTLAVPNGLGLAMSALAGMIGGTVARRR